MLVVYRGLFTESSDSRPQWVVTLIIGMFGPYCSIRFTSRRTGFVSQIANKNFNFVVRCDAPDLEPNSIWSSEDENEFYGVFELIYPMPESHRVLDLPRTLANVWIRASWRPAHASIVWPVDGVWCHIALRPPRGISSWQYEFGPPETHFSAPPRSRMPMTLKILDECPTVPWLEELRSKRVRTPEPNDPSSSSHDIPEDVPPPAEENHATDSLSRVSTGMPDSMPGQETNHEPAVPTGEYSSSVVQVDEESHQPIIGPIRSVSYLRTLFENSAPPVTSSPNRSTNDELFSIEIATGEEELISNTEASDTRPISAYANFPRRGSSTSGESEHRIRIHHLLNGLSESE